MINHFTHIALRCIAFTFMLLFSFPIIKAKYGDTVTEEMYTQPQPRLLIINSYNETKPYVIDIDPITKAAGKHDVKVSLEHLENLRVKDNELYTITVNNLFSKYHESHPDYVVLIGGLAFSMLDRIHEEWGNDIPIIYIGISDQIGQRENYYTYPDNFVDFSTWQSVEDLCHGMNLLFINEQYFPEATIDLMVKTIPNLKKIIFLSDIKWINRYINYRAKSYINNKYPQINYEWESCSDKNRKNFADIISQKHNTPTGLLLSTWNYERDGVLGYPVLVTQDYMSIATSPNPVFTLSPLYLQFGTIGGHYYDQDEYNANITYGIDRMLSGERLDTIPYFKSNSSSDIINYDRYSHARSQLGVIPENVTVINEPPSFWDNYKWVIIIALIIVIALTSVTYIITKEQRSRLQFLQRFNNIVQGMPIAFVLIDLQLDKDRKIISYNIGKGNRRYRKILKENGLTDKSSEKYNLALNQMIDEVQQAILDPDGKPKTLTRHFPETGKTYEWLIVRDPQLDKCYIYAVDISQLADSRQMLSETRDQLKVALLSANLIPWIWEIPEKTISFDRARSIDPSDKTDTTIISRRGYLHAQQLVRLTHPDDRVKLANLFNDIVAGKICRWEGFLRIKENPISSNSKYRNAKITALVSKTDQDGRALSISGAALLDPDRANRLMPSMNDDKDMNHPIPDDTSKNILIIEPCESNFILYQAVLSKEYNVFRAHTPEDCAQILSEVAINLSIINIDIDVNTIINIEQSIHGLHPNIPIIAITSTVNSISSFNGRHREMFTSILTIPVTPSNLMQDAKRLISAGFHRR